jgi:hypothetical protein
MHNRKNHLFAGADTGGERAAGIYSLIGTAKLNDSFNEARVLRFFRPVTGRKWTTLAD